MLRKLKDALPERAEHQAALDELEEGLKGEYGAALDQWREQVERWEDDITQANPFERRAESKHCYLPCH